MPGYEVKQERIAITGVEDLVIRSLLDKQQFADPQGDAERLGISSSLWPLFGLLWPSGSHLASRLGARTVVTDASSRSAAAWAREPGRPPCRRGRDGQRRIRWRVASSRSLVLNDLSPMKYRHGRWPAWCCRATHRQRTPVVVHGRST